MLNKIKGKMKGNKGFTLVELIVVVAIIGILLALAVPRLLGYTEEARRRADEQLAALYGNTFDILIGSGKMVNDAEVEIVVNAAGVMSIKKDGGLFPTDEDGNKITADKYVGGDVANSLNTKIRDEYISKSRKTGGNPAPQTFKSKAYTTVVGSNKDADGILITIDAAGNVTVEINYPV